MAQQIRVTGENVAETAFRVAAAAVTWRLIGGYRFDRAADELVIFPGAPDPFYPTRYADPEDVIALVRDIVAGHGLYPCINLVEASE